MKTRLTYLITTLISFVAVLIMGNACLNYKAREKVLSDQLHEMTQGEGWSQWSTPIPVMEPIPAMNAAALIREWVQFRTNFSGATQVRYCVVQPPSYLPHLRHQSE